MIGLLQKKTGRDFYDHELYELVVEYNDGEDWLPLTAEMFPAKGVEVRADLPEGVTAADKPAVIHMFGEDCNGYYAGNTEIPKNVKVEDDQIIFRINGMSPLMMAWGTAEEDPGDGMTLQAIDGTNVRMIAGAVSGAPSKIGVGLTFAWLWDQNEILARVGNVDKVYVRVDEPGEDPGDGPDEPGEDEPIIEPGDDGSEEEPVILPTDETPEDEPADEPAKEDTDKKDAGKGKTGDTTNPTIWILLAAIAAAGLGLMTVPGRRKEK